MCPPYPLMFLLYFTSLSIWFAPYCLNCRGSLFLQLHPSALTVILWQSAPSRPRWGHLVPWKKPQGDLRAASPPYLLRVAPQVKAPLFHLSGDQGAGVARAVVSAVVSAPASRRGLASRPALAAFGSRAAQSRAVLSSWSFSHETQESGHSTHLLSQPNPSGNGNHSTAFFLKEINSLLISFYFFF